MNNELYALAKKAERESNWREAARLWKLDGRMDDYNACITIAEAIEYGDKYRARVLAEAGEEPNKCEDPRAWVKWYDHMTAIYFEMYKNK